jgi:hypothetical protein
MAKEYKKYVVAAAIRKALKQIREEANPNEPHFKAEYCLKKALEFTSVVSLVDVEKSLATRVTKKQLYKVNSGNTNWYAFEPVLIQQEHKPQELLDIPVAEKTVRAAIQKVLSDYKKHNVQFTFGHFHLSAKTYNSGVTEDDIQKAIDWRIAKKQLKKVGREYRFIDTPPTKEISYENNDYSNTELENAVQTISNVIENSNNSNNDENTAIDLLFIERLKKLSNQDFEMYLVTTSDAHNWLFKVINRLNRSACEDLTEIVKEWLLGQ